MERASQTCVSAVALEFEGLGGSTVVLRGLLAPKDDQARAAVYPASRSFAVLREELGSCLVVMSCLASVRTQHLALSLEG